MAKKRKNFRLPNGAGSVYKLPGNRRNPWTAVMHCGYENDGRAMRKYIGYYPSQEDALHALEMYKETPFDLNNKGITIERLYEILMERKQGKADKTIKSYHTAYNHLKALQQMPIRKLRTHDYQKIVDSLDTKYESRAKIKNLVNQLYKIAIELDIINKNYATPITCGENEASTIHRPFSALEIRKIWELAKTEPFAKIVLIMCYTGMRPQELTRVKKEDVHVENAYFVGGMKTKAGKKRIIPIHQDILPTISVFVQNNKTHLIETSKGKPYSYNLLYYHWRAFMESAGLDHLPHDCRHTFTTFARKKNLDPLLVKRIVGHKSTDLTEQVYTHTDIQDLVTAVNML